MFGGLGSDRVAVPRDDWWWHLGERRKSLPDDAVFACTTAAWMHGLDLRTIERIEIALPPTCTVRSCVGVIVRRSWLAPAERMSVRGLPATSVHRNPPRPMPVLSPSRGTRRDRHGTAAQAHRYDETTPRSGSREGPARIGTVSEACRPGRACGVADGDSAPMAAFERRLATT